MFMFLRCRRRLAFSGRSIAGVEVLSAPLTSEANSDAHMISVDGSGAHRAADFHGSGFEGVEVSVNSDGTWMPVEGLNEPLTPEAHSDQMSSADGSGAHRAANFHGNGFEGAEFLKSLSFIRRSVAGVEGLSEPLTPEARSDQMSSADGSEALSSGGIWMPPLSSTVSVPRDAQDFDRIRMTPVSSTVTVPRYSRDLDGISPSSLQLLLRESAAPAFMGEGLSLVPKPTCTNIHTRASPSQ